MTTEKEGSPRNNLVSISEVLVGLTAELDRLRESEKAAREEIERRDNRVKDSTFEPIERVEVVRLRRIEAEHEKLKAAAKAWARSGNVPREDWAVVAQDLANLVDPPKRPEPRAGLRIKWTNGKGEERRGEIVGHLADAMPADLTTWLVRIDIAPDNSNYRELPDEWECE